MATTRITAVSSYHGSFIEKFYKFQHYNLKHCEIKQQNVSDAKFIEKQTFLLKCMLVEQGDNKVNVKQNRVKSVSVRIDQFSSVTRLCLTLCNPMNCSTPGLPVHHQLPEFTQTHVHQVGDAIQPSHSLSSPFPPAPNPSQHQSLFQ